MSKRAIVHIEIPAANREAGAEFYAKLFGWEYQHMNEPAPYTMIETGNVGIGMPDTGEMYAPNDVIVYIDSDDLTADLAQIESLGGKRIGEPIKVGDFGEMAFFTDPTGNRLALWRAFEMSGG